jgi:diguanylate cyclase (GGDEF)-like protein
MPKLDSPLARSAVDVPRSSQGYRFARRTNLLRTIGFGASSIPIAVVGFEEHTRAPLIAFVVLVCLAWPWIARYLATLSSSPLRGQRRNLIIDSALGGAFAAFMQFAPVPTYSAFVIFAVNSMAGGGVPGFVGALLAMGVGAAAGFGLTGGTVFHGNTLTGATSWLPLLTIYVLLVAHLAYEMAVKLADRSHRLRELGRKDPLTGLLNRQALIEELTAQLVRPAEPEGGVTLFYIDLDGFKLVNDSFGHPTGDALLVEMAARISITAEGQVATGRLGGDEFLVIASRLSDAERADIAERLLEQLSQPVIIEGRSIEVECSIGSSESPADGDTPAALISKADAAMYAAKRAGRNCFRAYGDAVTTLETVAAS